MSGPFADPTDPAAVDETCLLIGRFIHWFSQYTGQLLLGISTIARGTATQNRILWSLTESMTEAELRRQFFAAAALLRQSSEAEARIARKLRLRGEALGEQRNYIAHGLWLLQSNVDGGTLYEPSLWRTRAKIDGPDHEPILRSRAELRELVAEAEEVYHLFGEYCGCLISETFANGREPYLRITERLGFDDDGVLVRLHQ